MLIKKTANSKICNCRDIQQSVELETSKGMELWDLKAWTRSMKSCPITHATTLLEAQSKFSITRTQRNHELEACNAYFSLTRSQKCRGKTSELAQNQIFKNLWRSLAYSKLKAVQRFFIKQNPKEIKQQIDRRKRH